ncbi:hypothetical protein ASC94_07875 [Massilia sp. Root418]|jgi:hypothetical protein|uniref:hypothetical protein n=1 Tax=Massilia sp. Root418 TaxID=1736532 RepID=UPI000701ACD5|nr:hypothetical protein [Massilia sp. Root418]KQW96736.1 hypothetical protein ASC94_07875 [Massilia sp. Root418]
MKQLYAALILVAACAAGHGAETDPLQKSPCAQPNFPARSATLESVRLVEKALREWRACFRVAAAQQQSVDAMMASAHDYQLVKARHEAWVKATVAQSNGQPYGRLAANRVERDFWENLMADRSYPAAKHAPAQRHAEAALQQVSGSN